MGDGGSMLEELELREVTLSRNRKSVPLACTVPYCTLCTMYRGTRQRTGGIHVPRSPTDSATAVASRHAAAAAATAVVLVLGRYSSRSLPYARSHG